MFISTQKILAISCALFVYLLSATAYSADIQLLGRTLSPNGDNSSCVFYNVKLSGEIRSGDLEKLKLLISELPDLNKDRSFHARCQLEHSDNGASSRILLTLESRGGDWNEALKMTLYIYSLANVTTYVAKDKNCLSACAIIFLGGSTPFGEGDVTASRILHRRAHLGFHAPYPTLKKNVYNKDAVEIAFEQAFVQARKFFELLKKLGIDQRLTSILLQPTKDDFFYIDTVYKLRMVGARTDLDLTRSGLSIKNDRPYKSNRLFSIPKLSLAGAKSVCISQWFFSKGYFNKYEEHIAYLYKRNYEPGDPFERESIRSVRTKDGLKSFFKVPVEAADEGTFRYCVLYEKTMAYGFFWGETDAVAINQVIRQTNSTFNFDALNALPPNFQIKNITKDVIRLYVSYAADVRQNSRKEKNRMDPLSGQSRKISIDTRTLKCSISTAFQNAHWCSKFDFTDRSKKAFRSRSAVRLSSGSIVYSSDLFVNPSRPSLPSQSLSNKLQIHTVSLASDFRIQHSKSLQLVPLRPDQKGVIASSGSLNLGILVDHYANIRWSAKNNKPLYLIKGSGFGQVLVNGKTSDGRYFTRKVEIDPMKIVPR